MKINQLRLKSIFQKDQLNINNSSINLNTRIIDIQGIGDLFHTKEDTLYDLIKADLVEKVEE